jgi:hypothetical protein
MPVTKSFMWENMEVYTRNVSAEAEESAVISCQQASHYFIQVGTTSLLISAAISRFPS